jgi:amino acid transporter
MASGISAHAGVSRLMYVMGRDGVINKKIFGHISPKTYPVLQYYYCRCSCINCWFLTLNMLLTISFGALTAFTFVNSQ